MKRVLIAGLIGCWGAAVLFASTLGSSAVQAWQLILLAGLGAFVAGLVTAQFFGRAGWQGWACAIWAGVGSTALGGAVSGLLFSAAFWTQGINPIVGTFLGISFAVVTPFTELHVAVVWVVGLTGIHLMARLFAAKADSAA